MAFCSASSVGRPRNWQVKKRLCALSLFFWQKKVPEGETMAFFSASSVSRPRK